MCDHREPKDMGTLDLNALAREVSYEEADMTIAGDETPEEMQAILRQENPYESGEPFQVSITEMREDRRYRIMLEPLDDRPRQMVANYTDGRTALMRARHYLAEYDLTITDQGAL